MQSSDVNFDRFEWLNQKSNEYERPNVTKSTFLKKKAMKKCQKFCRSGNQGGGYKTTPPIWSFHKNATDKLLNQKTISIS